MKASSIIMLLIGAAVAGLGVYVYLQRKAGTKGPDSQATGAAVKPLPTALEIIKTQLPNLPDAGPKVVVPPPVLTGGATPNIYVPASIDNSPAYLERVVITGNGGGSLTRDLQPRPIAGDVVSMREDGRAVLRDFLPNLYMS